MFIDNEIVLNTQLLEKQYCTHLNINSFGDSC